jgi:hypothetical protein
MEATVTFVIPILHPANARDWALVKRNLSETIGSVRAQTDPGWQAVIVANHGADLPSLPPGFQEVRVDFPPNPGYERNGADREMFLRGVQLDKGRRVLAGMLACPGTIFYMVVDGDDFVSNRIVAYASRHRGENGWVSHRGYVWHDGSRLLYAHPDFSSWCGTSLVIRRELYGLPSSVEAATDDYLRTMLGSHIKIAGILKGAGTPLVELPFHGAVYRVGHGCSVTRSKGILSSFILTPRTVKRPRTLLRNMLRICLSTPSIRQEYFGGP